MARQINRLTQMQAEHHVKQHSSRIRYIHDGGGLYLAVDGRRCRPGDRPTASWVYRYMLYGKARMMGLGPFPQIKLSDARKAATDARGLKARGQDPLAVKDIERATRTAAQARAVTFKQVAQEYVRANEVKWSNPKHAAQWSSTLKTYAYPIIGETIVADVDATAVLKVLRQDVVSSGKRSIPFWEAKPETASRLRGRIETVLDYARVKGLRAGDNPAAWRGNLKLALPAKAKVRRVKHHAALPVATTPAFMCDLRKKIGTAAKALELAVLTAARTGEILGATWREIDLDAGVWCIPAARMKAGREHRVPLSATAISLLKGQMPGSAQPGALVFPGSRLGKPLSNMALLMLLRSMDLGDVTAHGFRSTFRDWVSEHTDYASELAERALAHTINDKTEAAYARGDLFQKRKALMEAWADFCDGRTPLEAAA